MNPAWPLLLSPCQEHGARISRPARPTIHREGATVGAFYELCSTSRYGIFAVPCRDGRRGKPIRLPDGAIAERLQPDERCEAPNEVASLFEVASGGMPATIHHANLGLIVGYLKLTGLYLLSNGEVAAVYGAEAVPIGVAHVSRP
jgi:hypothetical protein